LLKSAGISGWVSLSLAELPAAAITSTPAFWASATKLAMSGSELSAAPKLMLMIFTPWAMAYSPAA
jgi:hypothetical protein